MRAAHKRRDRFVARAATAPLAAGGLIAGFGVADATGSRSLGGVVLVAFGVTCIAIWLKRDGRRTATLLTIWGLAAFAISHVLGLWIGAWPAVLLVAAATAGVCWRMSDARRGRVGFSRRTAADSPRTRLRAGRPGPLA